MKKFPTRFLKRKTLIFKSLYYLWRQDREGVCLLLFSQHPYRYLVRLFLLFFSREEKISFEGYFFHGYRDQATFEKEVSSPENIFIIGQSYCQKPLDCPSKRFSDHCEPHCNRCNLQKTIFDLPLQTHGIVITTVLSLAKKFLQYQKLYPKKKVLFLISACPYAINLFSPWAKVLGVQGMSIPLKGAVCSSFASFVAAEGGEKGFATLLDKKAQEKIFYLLALRKKAFLA